MLPCSICGEAHVGRCPEKTDDTPAPVEGHDTPERIWLEPICQDDQQEGRCWCADPIPDCEEPGCGAKAVEYVRADLTRPALSDHARALREAAPDPMRKWKRRRKRALKAIAHHAEVVMRYLAEDGARVVPHLIDTDDNPGQRLRWNLRQLAKAEAKLAALDGQDAPRAGGEG